MSRLYILEGPDGCGKSTLAKALVEVLGPGTMLIHHGPYPNDTHETLWRRYLDAMLPAYVSDPAINVVFDRSWLSEPIYGAAYRGGANRISQAQRAVLEVVARGRDAALVFCRIPWVVCVENFRVRKAAGGEMLADTTQLKIVYDEYKRLEHSLAYDKWFFTPCVTHFNFADGSARSASDVVAEINAISRSTRNA